MSAASIPTRPRRTAVLTVFLSFVMLLFISILVFVWVETKRANPIFLDEHGKPIGQHPIASGSKAE